MSEQQQVETEAGAGQAKPVVTRAETNRQIREIAAVTGFGQAWIDAQLDADTGIEQGLLVLTLLTSSERM